MPPYAFVSNVVLMVESRVLTDEWARLAVVEKGLLRFEYFSTLRRVREAVVRNRNGRWFNDYNWQAAKRTYFFLSSRH